MNGDTAPTMDREEALIVLREAAADYADYLEQEVDDPDQYGKLITRIDEAIRRTR